ncbi:MAG: hypothetical protein AB7S65_04545 [Sulfuricurvum sp.]
MSTFLVLLRKMIWFTLIAYMASGCFNERGISLRYYNGCEEYYDVQGYLHKKCDPNLMDYKELYTPPSPTRGNVE